MTDRKQQLESMLADRPDDTFLRFALGMEHVKLGQHAPAIEQFDRVLEADPGYIAAYAQKGQVCEQLGRFDQAKSAYRAGIVAASAAGDAHAATKMQESLDRLVRTTGQ